MVGTRIKYRAPNGDVVHALQYDTRADLPVFDIEIVRAGEVVRNYEIAGYYALLAEAARRRWVEAG